MKVSLKSCKNNGYFTCTQIQIFDHISLSLLRMKNVSDKSCRGNRSTYFVFSIVASENRPVYEIMLQKYCRAGQATDDNRAHAGYLRLQTHT